MSDVIRTNKTAIAPMSDESIKAVCELEAAMKQLPQEAITTDHTLHAGVYTRTVKILKGVAICGALIKCSTNIIISGHVLVTLNGEQVEIEGFASIPASANRKQSFVALEDTYLTMYFATKAATIDVAEREFTDDYGSLISRKQGSINNITITGE